MVYALQANGIDRADTAGCNGAGWREQECYTLNTVDKHAVAYDQNIHLMDAYQHHGYRDGETCGTLTVGQNNTVRGDTPLCVFDITGTNSNSMKSPTPDSCFRARDVGRTLDTFVGSPECNQGGDGSGVKR